VLADLLAHELAASHRLMQRIAAATDGILSWSAEVNGADEATGRPTGDSAAGHRVEPVSSPPPVSPASPAG
jgi:hypothetical protein